ncbi:AAA family ATPase [Streptomyces tanashiensis]|uniref:AAA family ATPase n=1 Tax=Streptomyces tanashiensis TaxID=67367 RepID=UPI0034054202
MDKVTVGPCMLEERDGEIESLTRWWGEACVGIGRLVLVGGDAGAGKAVLVEEFGRRLGDVRLLRGSCEPLTTPLAFGPLRDMAHSLSPPLRQKLTGPADPVDARRLMLDGGVVGARCRRAAATRGEMATHPRLDRVFGAVRTRRLLSMAERVQRTYRAPSARWTSSQWGRGPRPCACRCR